MARFDLGGGWHFIRYAAQRITDAHAEQEFSRIEGKYKGVRGVLRNAPRILVGNDARALDLLQRLLPGTYWARVKGYYERLFNAPVDGAPVNGGR